MRRTSATNAFGNRIAIRAKRVRAPRRENDLVTEPNVDF